MGHTVHSLFLSTLKGRKRLLGGPGRGGRLLGHWRGFDEAAVEGVLRIVVGYWEQKTNKGAARSSRRRCTILQEQQFCCQSLLKLLQSLRKRCFCWKPFPANISNFEGWRGPHSSCFLCFKEAFPAKDKRSSVFISFSEIGGCHRILISEVN